MSLGELSITESEKKDSEPASVDPPQADLVDPQTGSDDSVDLETTDTERINPNLGNANFERSRELAFAAARVAAENGGRDIKILDMSEHTPMFDFFVIASGSSRRQLHAMSEEIDHKLEDDLQDKRVNIDGYDESRWIVLDYSTVVIHLFDDETRAYYSLESLWADATEVDLTGIIEVND